MQARVFEFGLGEPDPQTLAIVAEQIWRAHRYRNKLVEIEHARRKTVQEALQGHADVASLQTELDQALAQLEAARTAIRLARQATRKRKVDPALIAGCEVVRARVKDLGDQVRTAKRAICEDPTIRATFAAAEDAARARVREERKQCGVYWGTYLLVEAAADAARKSKTPPKFQRWRYGEGAVGVQLQGGLALEELWGGDTQLQIDPVPAAAHDAHTPRGERRRLCRTTVRMRLGSDGRAPIWGTWPLILHRPLPPGSRVKAATIARWRRDATHWEWHLRLQLELPDGWAPAPAGTGMCALNLGWCQRPTGIRVGYVVGEDGLEREIIVPPSVGARLDQAARIQAHRDRNLNELRPALTQALGALAASTWLLEATQHLAAWKSADRFRRLYEAWKTRRFEGDAAAFDLLAAWYAREIHLHQFQAGATRGALNHRREVFRLAAAELAARYRTLVYDDTNLMAFQESPQPEEDAEIAIVKQQQRVSAPHTLRLALISAFARAGAIERESCADVTRRCYSCGSLEVVAAADRVHTCTSCNTRWDQDANACMNLLKRARERLADADGIKTARGQKPNEIKPSRSKRLRAGRDSLPATGPLAGS